MIHDTACVRQTFPFLSVVGRVAWRFPIVCARPTREIFDHALREHKRSPASIPPLQASSQSPILFQGQPDRSSIALFQRDPSSLYVRLLKGAAEAALYCAHRTSTFLSCAFCEQEGYLGTPFSSLQACSLSLQGWGLIDLRLRASNEGLLRPRVARARKIISLHPLFS